MHVSGSAFSLWKKDEGSFLRDGCISSEIRNFISQNSSYSWKKDTFAAQE